MVVEIHLRLDESYGTQRRTLRAHTPLVEERCSAIPDLTFNARSEGATEKPTWRHSLRRLRCRMPARGWCEWNEKEKVRNESDRKVR